jgi:hypothetical protein
VQGSSERAETRPDARRHTNRHPIDVLQEDQQAHEELHNKNKKADLILNHEPPCLKHSSNATGVPVQIRGDFEYSRSSRQ